MIGVYYILFVFPSQFQAFLSYFDRLSVEVLFYQERGKIHIYLLQIGWQENDLVWNLFCLLSNYNHFQSQTLVNGKPFLSAGLSMSVVHLLAYILLPIFQLL